MNERKKPTSGWPRTAGGGKGRGGYLIRKKSEFRTVRKGGDQGSKAGPVQMKRRERSPAGSEENWESPSSDHETSNKKGRHLALSKKILQSSRHSVNTGTRRGRTGSPEVREDRKDSHLLFPEKARRPGGPTGRYFRTWKGMPGRKSGRQQKERRKKTVTSYKKVQERGPHEREKSRRREKRRRSRPQSLL